MGSEVEKTIIREGIRKRAIKENNLSWGKPRLLSDLHVEHGFLECSLIVPNLTDVFSRYLLRVNIVPRVFDRSFVPALLKAAFINKFPKDMDAAQGAVIPNNEEVICERPLSKLTVVVLPELGPPVITYQLFSLILQNVSSCAPSAMRYFREMCCQSQIPTRTRSTRITIQNKRPKTPMPPIMLQPPYCPIILFCTYLFLLIINSTDNFDLCIHHIPAIVYTDTPWGIVGTMKRQYEKSNYPLCAYRPHCHHWDLSCDRPWAASCPILSVCFLARHDLHASLWTRRSWRAWGPS